MKDKQHITIHIADVAPIERNIRPQEEEFNRKVEKELNKTWLKWRQDFPEKSSGQLLAMIAFQYAQAYYRHIEKLQNEEEALAEAEAALDSILLDVK
ncbi:MAG: cell division protein ZapA [Bacteroidales bacterium]|nr:cell division protein ZapA [Bacteroidales bacterium]